jgi:hypothetical protein
MEQSCTGASMGMCGDGVNRVRVGSTPHRGKGRLGHVCTGEGQEKGRDLFLNINVAQFLFYDIDLGTILTQPGKIGPE